MTIDNDQLAWNAKHDAFRPTTDFSDLLKIVACYYEMYSRCATFIGPWIAKQHGMIFVPPDKEDIKQALGKERALISFRARSSFIEAVIQHITKTRGKKTLITPNPSSHHSAQFPAGTFQISAVTENKPMLKNDKGPRTKGAIVHRIDFYGAEYPVYIENLRLPPEQIQFIIVRPKLGKLGTPSSSRWEVLLYKKHLGYLVEHVDSHLNPRWAGIY
jgi:hypothetical protein